MPESTKEKLRIALKGRKPTEETRRKLSAARLGKRRPPFSGEHKQALSASIREGFASGRRKRIVGRTHSEATRSKMRCPRPSTSAKWSDPEWRAKTLADRAAAAEARGKAPPSDRRIAAAKERGLRARGRDCPDDVREKCRAASKSKWMDAEHREKCLAARHTRYITHDGRTMCLAEWARVIGISESTIALRLKRGWTIERALLGVDCRRTPSKE